MFENHGSNVIAFKPRKTFCGRRPVLAIGVVHTDELFAFSEHVAQKLGIRSDTVRAMVAATFHLRKFEQLHLYDFEQAMKYLTNLLNDHVKLH